MDIKFTNDCINQLILVSVTSLLGVLPLDALHGDADVMLLKANLKSNALGVYLGGGGGGWTLLDLTFDYYLRTFAKPIM